MTIWMEVDLNNKELPLRVADRARDLARMKGLNPTSVTNAYSRARKLGQRCRYVKVEIEEDDNE
jgi:hypothetical protein